MLVSLRLLVALPGPEVLGLWYAKAWRRDCGVVLCSSWCFRALQYQDMPNGLAALSKLPVLGGAQIIAFAGLIETTGIET